MEKNHLYLLNGLLMAISFGVFRIYYYHSIIFTYFPNYMIYHDYAFMPSIYKNDQLKIGLIYFSVVVYLMMYGL